MCFVVTGPPFSGKTHLISQVFDKDNIEFFDLRTGKEIEFLKKNFEDKQSNKKTIVIEMCQKRRYKR